MDTADISQLLGRIFEVDGVSATAVSTTDGLLIEGRGDEVRLESMAAIGTLVLASAARLGEIDGGHSPSAVQAEWDHGTVLLRRLSPDTNLIVLLERQSNAAYVAHIVGRYQMERPQTTETR